MKPTDLNEINISAGFDEDLAQALMTECIEGLRLLRESETRSQTMETGSGNTCSHHLTC